MKIRKRDFEKPVKGTLSETDLHPDLVVNIPTKKVRIQPDPDQQH
jgi:hypothetical protein